MHFLHVIRMERMLKITIMHREIHGVICGVFAVAIDTILLFGSVFPLHAQSLYVEHTGPQDVMINSIWVPRDSSQVDFSLVQKKIPLLETYYVSPKCFDILESALKSEVVTSATASDPPIWSNIRVSFFDASMNLMETRVICCHQEALQVFDRLMHLRKVQRNPSLLTFLSYYYDALSEVIGSDL